MLKTTANAVDFDDDFELIFEEELNSEDFWINLFKNLDGDNGCEGSRLEKERVCSNEDEIDVKLPNSLSRDMKKQLRRFSLAFQEATTSMKDLASDGHSYRPSFDFFPLPPQSDKELNKDVAIKVIDF
ncbi:hypothetical protein PTKIN_Ptkin11bG0144800 [Pterospermum kingtungense]